MSDEEIYIVSSSGPEDYSPQYLIGPRVDCWEAYCRSLAAETSAKAIELSTKGNIDEYGHVNTCNNNIYKEDLARTLITVLLTKGYRTIRFISYDIGWRDEVDDDYPYNETEIHNLQCYIDEMEERFGDELSNPQGGERPRWLKREIEDAAAKMTEFGGSPKINAELMAKINKLLEGAKE